MTKNERINRDLQRLRDSARLVLYDPEVWRLVIDTLPNGRYEVSIDYGDNLESDPDVVIAAWSFVVFEVTSFYTTLEEIERL